MATGVPGKPMQRKGNNAKTTNIEENAESGIYVRMMTKLQQRPT